MHSAKHQEINFFIVPHSHTDPGWLETLELYYKNQVRDILYNILTELQADKAKRFVWAETVFLKMFYDDLSFKDKELLRRVIDSGQMEIVGGGWV